MSTWRRSIIWVSVFAVAMALLEAAVVVYLRALYYPNGFRFPLVPIAHDLGVTEVAREAATLLMLLAPGTLIARSALERFAWFCFCFGVWDLFYYVWLKVLLGWPASLFDWDILFLIPVPWVGPVLAPCLISVGLIALALILLHGRSRSIAFRPWPLHWTVLIICAAIMIVACMMDYLNYLGAHDVLRSAWSVGPGAEATFAQATGYVPEHFPWWFFLSGYVPAGLATADLWRRSIR